MSKAVSIAFNLLCLDVAQNYFKGPVVNAQEVNLKADEIAEVYMMAAEIVSDGNGMGTFHVKVEG